MERKRKTAMNCARRIPLIVAALAALLVAVPLQASASGVSSFRATIHETFTEVPCSPIPSICVTAAGSGHAKHLGRISEAATVIVDLTSNPAPACLSEMRTTTITAAHGATLMLVGPGRSCVTGATSATALDTFVVTGGTGRFRGVSGRGSVTTTIDMANRTAVVNISGWLSSEDEDDTREGRG